MKKINAMLRRCRSLTKLGRPQSTVLRSNSAVAGGGGEGGGGGGVVVLVGSSKRPYLLSRRHLDHPLLCALLEKPSGGAAVVSVRCEVVIFDHLLWMLENAGPAAAADCSELATLYSS